MLPACAFGGVGLGMGLGESVDLEPARVVIRRFACRSKTGSVGTGFDFYEICCSQPVSDASYDILSPR